MPFLLRDKFFLLTKSLINYTAYKAFHVRDRIRTPGLLVRSQTLYPAELHVLMSTNQLFVLSYFT